MLRCAFCEKDITPPLGTIIPGDFKARFSDGVLKPLMTRVLVANDGAKTCALAVVDSCGLYADVAEGVRESVAERCDISPDSIMVMATHSHSAGPTLNWGEQIRVNPQYIDMIITRTADAIVEAYNKLVPAAVHTNRSTLEGVSFIRVFKLTNDRLKTNPGLHNPDIIEPACEIDREISVAYIMSDGNPIGAIINFALHPAIVCGTKSHGDYISIISEEMKKKFGNDFITLFINGACGNINHINPLDDSTVTPGIHETIGKKIAKTSIVLLDEAKKSDGSISFARTPIRLRRRKATPDMLIAAAEHLDSLGDELEDNAPGTPGYIETFFAMEAIRSRCDRTIFTETELQAIRLSGIHIYGVPAQIFCEFGVRIKSNAPFSMVSAFANDYIGYIPTPDCMKPGVYEARLATTSRHTPEAGNEICSAMAKLHSML